jgi:hypothetical protein
MQSKNQPSTMGLNLAALAHQATATKWEREKEGRLLSQAPMPELSAQPRTNR